MLEFVPPVLGVLAALGFDLASRRRRLEPPAFVRPERRFTFLLLLALIFGFTLFPAIALLGERRTVDFALVSTWQLFALHFILIVTLLAWWVLGFAGTMPRRLLPRELARQLGLTASRPGVEMAIGLVAGVACWGVVVAILLAVGSLIVATRGPEALPQAPPPMIVWIAGLPIGLRAALAASAGFCEELFFRGFLQPRLGLLASTAIFVVAHLSYDEPLLLVGVTLLSLLYGALVRWRQSIWAAVVAHALFDAVQLLVIIPLVLRFLAPAASGP